MAKLYVWIAERTDDSQAYSLIGKTKKAVQEQLDQVLEEQKDSPWKAHFGPIERKVINYKDAFDLYDWCTGEAGGRYAVLENIR